MKYPIVAIQGGLGNQLSQWYFAHSITKSRQFQIDPLHEMSEVGLRNFELQPLLRVCSHVQGSRNGHFHTRYAKIFYHFLDRLWEFSWMRKSVESFGYFREDPRTDQEQSETISESIKYAKGYFQKQTKIESIFETVESELIPVVQGILPGLKEKYDLTSDYTVIHVRRGDYETTEFTPINIGTLADEYFTKWSANQDISDLILLTENREDVLELLEQLKPSLVLDKKDTTPWETLAIMYGAKRFLGSNSSLSWWGGRLCSTRKGEVWLPSEWSFWRNIDVSDYHFSTCNIADVYWIQDRSEI